MLHHSVCVIERLCEDGEGRDAVRVGGGIPFLLNLLSRNENTSFNQENSDKVKKLKLIKYKTCIFLASEDQKCTCK